MSDTLLVTGGSGYLGDRVLAHASTNPDQGWRRIVGTTFSQAGRLPRVEYVPVDLTNAAEVEALLNATRPAAVIHTAAATPGRHELFWPVNVAGSTTLARWCAATGTRLVHISSDAVFGGREQPYSEADQPDPITVYGASKAAAEAVVTALCPAAVLVRTSLIYGSYRPDSHTLLARQLQAGERQGGLFTDEYRCPILVDDLAQATLELAANQVAGPLHVAGSDVISRYDFGVALLRWAGTDPGGLPAGLLSESGLRRPSRLILTSYQASSLLRTRLRGVREVVDQEDYHGTDTRSNY